VHTGHRAPADLAVAFQTLSGVEAPAATRQLLPAVARGVEHHGVAADAAMLGRPQDEPSGQPGLDLGGMLEAERSKRRLCPRAVWPGDHEVEVVVGTGLLADESVDSPAAVEPHGNPGGAQHFRAPR
jgi:hypothetical protein